MTKKTNPLDDLNLDDISGDVTPATVQVAEEAIAAAIQHVDDHAIPLTEEEEWQACLSRLIPHCEKKGQIGDQWICIPVTDSEGKLFLLNREVKDATGEEFMTWLHLVYPPSKTQGFTAKECEEYKYRESIYENVVKTAEYFKFPKQKQLSIK